MCWVQIAFAAVAAISSIQKNREENKAKDRARQLVDRQNEQRADEIGDAASVELNERARAARRARASARAAASGAGINLNSASFLAELTAGLATQDVSAGLVVKNQNNQQKSRQLSYLNALEPLKKKSGLGIGIEAVASGAAAYSGSGGQMFMGNNPGAG